MVTYLYCWPEPRLEVEVRGFRNSESRNGLPDINGLPRTDIRVARPASVYSSSSYVLVIKPALPVE